MWCGSSASLKFPARLWPLSFSILPKRVRNTWVGLRADSPHTCYVLHVEKITENIGDSFNTLCEERAWKTLLHYKGRLYYWSRFPKILLALSKRDRKCCKSSRLPTMNHRAYRSLRGKSITNPLYQSHPPGEKTGRPNWAPTLSTALRPREKGVGAPQRKMESERANRKGSCLPLDTSRHTEFLPTCSRRFPENAPHLPRPFPPTAPQGLSRRAG